MSKSNRKEEIFHLGASAARRAYQWGLEDFNDLLTRLEEMKGFGILKKYSFKDQMLWVTTSNNFITGEFWIKGLDAVHALLDSLSPQTEKITDKTLESIEKGDLIALENGLNAYFVRWSLLKRNCAVLRSANKIRRDVVDKDLLIGATRIPKYQLRRRGKHV